MIQIIKENVGALIVVRGPNQEYIKGEIVEEGKVVVKVSNQDSLILKNYSTLNSGFFSTGSTTINVSVGSWYEPWIEPTIENLLKNEDILDELNDIEIRDIRTGYNIMERVNYKAVKVMMSYGYTEGFLDSTRPDINESVNDY